MEQWRVHIVWKDDTRNEVFVNKKNFITLWWYENDYWSRSVIIFCVFILSWRDLQIPIQLNGQFSQSRVEQKNTCTRLSTLCLTLQSIHTKFHCAFLDVEKAKPATQNQSKMWQRDDHIFEDHEYSLIKVSPSFVIIGDFKPSISLDLELLNLFNPSQCGPGVRKWN